MRCFVPAEQWARDPLVLDADETHHLAHVLRAEVGWTVVVFDGAGREAEARILELGRDRAALALLHHRAVPRPAVALSLVQALPREQRMDFILQKGTELGVSEIVPVVSDHAVVRLKEGDAAKRERWEKIVLNAAKQCGAAWLPTVRPVRPLMDVLKEVPTCDAMLVCSLEPDARPLRDVIAEVRKIQPRSLAFLVGPEGDFSSRELAVARQAGARPVNLGPAVLRVETAALYVMSVLKYELMDR